MCIRDSLEAGDRQHRAESDQAEGQALGGEGRTAPHHVHGCLLYTSDAADERSSVDLGGRRIIKKKKTDKRQEKQE